MFICYIIYLYIYIFQCRDLVGTRKRDFFGHARFCHPTYYFGSKVPQTKKPHQDAQAHDQKDAIDHTTDVSALMARIL